MKTLLGLLEIAEKVVKTRQLFRVRTHGEGVWVNVGAPSLCPALLVDKNH